jgi:hypothetical protein
MEVLKVYISEANLKKSAGSYYKRVLASLMKEGALLSYTPLIELRFDKAKAKHIQTVLEFYEVGEVPQAPKESHRRRDE